MARCQFVGAQSLRHPPEEIEFDLAIAADARTRRETGSVRLGKRLDDLLLERSGVVENIVRKADVRCDHAGVGDVGRGTAAAAACGQVHAAVVPQLQGQADDLMACLGEERRSDAGVHAAAHGDRDATHGASRGLVSEARTPATAELIVAAARSTSAVVVS